MLQVKRGSLNNVTESQGFRQHTGLSHGQPWEAAAPWGQGGAGPILPLYSGRCLCLRGLRPLTPALHTLGWLQLDGPGRQGPVLRGIESMWQCLLSDTSMFLVPWGLHSLHHFF